MSQGGTLGGRKSLLLYRAFSGDFWMGGILPPQPRVYMSKQKSVTDCCGDIFAIFLPPQLSH